MIGHDISLSAGYKMIIAALDAARLPLSTAAYPFVAVDTLQREALDKSGNICRITGAIHCVSEENLSEAFELAERAGNALISGDMPEASWRRIDAAVSTESVVTDTSDAANIVYRVSQNINLTIQQQ